MARNENLPFERGATYYNGGTIDQNELGGGNLEGKEYLAEVNPSGAPSASNSDPSGRQVLVRVVRNRSGINLKPARLAVYAVGSANGNLPLGTGVAGYAFADTDLVAGVIDEFLPPGGVPNGDLFYLVIDGPTRVTTPNSGAFTIAPGARIAPAAGTGATNDDSGRVLPLVAAPSVGQNGAAIGRADVTANVTATATAFGAVVRLLGR